MPGVQAPSVRIADEELSPLGHALAGALGGVFSNAVVYPLDTAKTRIQATDDKGKGKVPPLSIYEQLRRILKAEGLSGCYKGFGASMLNTFSMQYAYFFFYSLVRKAYIRRHTRYLPAGAQVRVISTGMELILGAIAGALAQIFTIPVSVIATRQQLYVEPSVTDEVTRGAKAKDNSFLGVGREIIREDGVAGLYAGLRPGLVLTVNPAITYGVYERLKSALLYEGEKFSPLTSFIVGAFSKTLATVATYPYIMAKVRMQAGPKEEEDVEAGPTIVVDGAEPLEGSAYTEVYMRSSIATPLIPPSAGSSSIYGTKSRHEKQSAVELLRKVYKERGFAGWYQGMSAQIIKAVLAQALLFMLKDQFERYALLIILLFRRFSVRH